MIQTLIVLIALTGGHPRASARRLDATMKYLGAPCARLLAFERHEVRGPLNLSRAQFVEDTSSNVWTLARGAWLYTIEQGLIALPKWFPKGSELYLDESGLVVGHVAPAG